MNLVNNNAIQPTQEKHVTASKDQLSNIAEKNNTSKVANLQFNKIQHIRIEKESSFLGKFTNAVLIYVLSGHFINKYTILSGTLKNWDSDRLLAGKHVSFGKLGAEHIQLKNKYNDSIDATYLEASALVHKLEQFGGKRVLFHPNLSDKEPYETSEVSLELEGGKKFPAEHINDNALITHMGDITPIQEYYRSKNMAIIMDSEGEKMYAIQLNCLLNFTKRSKSLITII